MNETFLLKKIKCVFETGNKRGWDKIYVGVDIHDTMLKANYHSSMEQRNLPNNWFPNMKELMVHMSNRPDIHLVLYTCSYPLEIKKYIEFFESEGVFFNDIGRNTDVKNTRHGYFNDKPYLNVLLDDNAGFDPIVHGKEILTFLKNNKEILNNCNYGK